MQHIWRGLPVLVRQGRREGDGRGVEGEAEPQMVANYVMLRVKERTKELITAGEMKCFPEGHRESLNKFYTVSFVSWKSQGSGIIGNSLKGRRGQLTVLDLNTKGIYFFY